MSEVTTKPLRNSYVARKPNGAPFDMEWLLRWAMPVPFCGCWIWMGALNKGGYGSVTVSGVKKNAFRVSYEIANGPLPKGLEPDHLCRVRSCINPDHLEAVTRRVNLLRGDGPKMLAARYRSRTHCPQGHAYSPENIYQDSRGWRGCRTCRAISAARFGAKRIKTKRTMSQ